VFGSGVLEKRQEWLENNMEMVEKQYLPATDTDVDAAADTDVDAGL
jgi:hypothetical protein